MLITAAGALVYKQIPDLPAMLGMGLIVAGVAVINLFSKTVSTDSKRKKGPEQRCSGPFVVLSFGLQHLVLVFLSAQHLHHVAQDLEGLLRFLGVELAQGEARVDDDVIANGELPRP